MSEVKHTPWEVGQHPAVSNGWIVRPIMLGSNVRVLPEHEGGHVMFKDEAVAHKVAAAEDMYERLKSIDVDLCILMGHIGEAEQRDPRWVGMAERVGDWRAEISSVIAKAEGRA
jgi:hypothetical protein